MIAYTRNEKLFEYARLRVVRVAGFIPKQKKKKKWESYVPRPSRETVESPIFGSARRFGTGCRNGKRKFIRATRSGVS